MHLRSRLPTHTHVYTYGKSYVAAAQRAGPAWDSTRCGTPVTCSHAVGRASHRPRVTGVQRLPHARAHTQTQLHAPEVSHKHPRHGPPHSGTLRHTQTIGLQAGRHTCGAFPHRCTPRNCGIIYLTPNQENTFHTCSKSHKDRHPQVLEFSGKGREGQARATKSHAQVHGYKVLV